MAQQYAFNADITQLMSLIINTFYSNKEIFLRELISNASDALSKANIASISDSSYLDSEPELKINIIPLPETKQLIIEDTGCGMSQAELIENLGTLAKSGTRAFIERINEAGDAGADVQNMIGQFGVGFYSAYLVATKVDVWSKANDSDSTYHWSSEAGSSFTVEKCDPVEGLKRGTRILLTLKKDQLEYLEANRIKELVKKHSEYIGYPINLVTYTETEEEVADEEDAAAKDDEEVVDETEKKTKLQKVKTQDAQLLNAMKPLWTRKPEDVTEEEYSAFYKSLSQDWQEHLAVKHFHMEGQLDVRGLLYVPKAAANDMFEAQGKRKANQIKLYVRRVFIMEDCKDLMPEWLSFIRGIVDSEDLPLSISREALQHDKILRVIKRTLVKKCLELFQELAENKDDYAKFYEAFSKNLKLGIHEDTANREKLADLLRYNSTRSGNEMISLQDYVDNMKPEQKSIYYIIGDNKAALANSPFIEVLKKKGYEVLLMTDAMDEYCITQLKEYKDCKLVDCSKDDLEIPLSDDEKASKQAQKAELEVLCRVAKDVLGDKVEKVVISDRLSQQPSAISTAAFGWSAQMAKIMKNQPLGAGNDMMYNFMQPKKTLELNPDHTIVKSLRGRVTDASNIDKVARDSIWLLYETSLLTSGFELDEPTSYASRIFKLIALGISDDLEADDVADDVPGLEEAGDEEMEEENVLEEID
jgi:molecular chaperone HtpG